MTDKQIIFKCDVDCIKKNTEECFELECIYGQESILRQLKLKEQKLAKIKEVLEPIKCKHPEDCWENKPDWNGEVYGCEPDDMDNIASCPSKVATSVLQIIEGKDNGI